jgi:hypothetical protein
MIRNYKWGPKYELIFGMCACNILGEISLIVKCVFTDTWVIDYSEGSDNEEFKWLTWQ